MSHEARLAELAARVAACERCPRLVEYCRAVAVKKRRAYQRDTYWGRPVPGFGDGGARVMLLGLAPGAHGANRTGRMFTGDGNDGRGASDFLAAALHALGAASQPTSRSRHDGFHLADVYLTAICRCAPPGNLPSRDEISSCAEYVHEELDLLAPRVIVALGKLAFDQGVRVIGDRGGPVPAPRPRFGHGAEFQAEGDFPLLLGSYHPSRLNMSTGVLTQAMLRHVLQRALDVAQADDS